MDAALSPRATNHVIVGKHKRQEAELGLLHDEFRLFLQSLQLATSAAAPEKDKAKRCAA